MNTYDFQFKRIVKDILTNGYETDDRTGVGTIKIPGAEMRVDMSSEPGQRMILPALTLRRVFPRVAFEELFWMLSGSCDARELQAKNIRIWDGNSSREYLDSVGLEHIREGFIGKGYGHQFRNFNGVDQLSNVLDSLRNNPSDRRMMISLWNPADLKESALPPCHVLYQFISTGNVLHLRFYQRSSDFILAASQNFMFAAFFLHFFAQLSGHRAGSLTHLIGDCHIYKNHVDVAKELLDKEGVSDFAEFVWKSPDREATLDEAISSMNWDDVIIDYKSEALIDRNRLIMAV